MKKITPEDVLRTTQNDLGRLEKRRVLLADMVEKITPDSVWEMDYDDNDEWQEVEYRETKKTIFVKMEGGEFRRSKFHMEQDWLDETKYGRHLEKHLQKELDEINQEIAIKTIIGEGLNGMQMHVVDISG